MTRIDRTWAYEAIARFGNRDAGFVCRRPTKDAARVRARELTSMTISLRRVLVARADVSLR
jgi:hypothetical protein